MCDGDCPDFSESRYSCPKLDGRTSENIVREREATGICKNLCPVFNECYEWITENPNDCRHGIVAGMTEATRRRMSWASNKVSPPMWDD